MKEIPVIKIYLWNHFVGALSWNDERGYATFQYDEQFPKLGLDLSPLTMPISRWRMPFAFPSHARTNCFRGLPGMIADCLPDKFGSQIINEWFAQKGKTENLITPLDRLCYVGKRAMGALEFIPAEKVTGIDESTEIYIQELMNISETLFKERANFQTLLRQEDKSILDILKVGTSAGGAKPKALIAYNEQTDEVRSGQVTAPNGFTYWLLKFDGGTYSEHNEITDNPRGIGNIEYAYYEMALKCGITMTKSKLLSEGECYHFMTKRFDRTDDGEKIHMLTAAGLAHLDRDERHSYEELFGILRRMGFAASDADQLFRRMVFNVEARNHDDHTKNFSFLMDKGGKWSLAPAYDLCYSYNPDGKWTSRHQLALNGKQSDFTREDLMAVATNIGIRNAYEIIDSITDVVGNWSDIAQDCGVRDEHRKQIAAQLLLL
ncbi:MAG: type II toxin-antitoxin system HipA family toxin [Bacteroidaceae bacterium]|nr:type II toxin-antitoxin system HipA family toxin [Bacteroidaceae bacterium]